jgi:hypothetical protein
MTSVEETDLKRNRIYMMYSIYEKQKALYFFSFREHLKEDMVRVVLHGKIYQKGVDKAVVDVFWKTEDILHLTTEDHSATIFEIEFSDFAHHVVSETI